MGTPRRARGLRATLAFLQHELHAIHGVRAPPVARYLVDRQAAEATGHAPRAPEELLVVESADGLSLGLFLAEEVRAAAAALDPHDPRPTLTARAALPRLAVAAEGVSHFVYLATRAARDRPVSLLELEVQAEVDTFALLLLHLWRRGRRRLSAALRRRLFDRVAFHGHLGAEDLLRYREALRLAAGYARWLEEAFVAPGDAEGLVRELRRSYRLGGGEKLAWLGARAA